MRLTCPNCGAEYEVPDGIIPPGGKHVQCTSCHTRWFMRGTARPLLSEDQVIQRLETWSPKPRFTTTPETPATVIQMPSPKPVDPDPFVWETPTKPAPPPEPKPVLSAERAPPIIRPRLELSPDEPIQPIRPPVRRRFRRGMLVAVVPVAVAVGVYVWKDPLSVQLPAAAPILSDYANVIDAGREWLDAKIATLRGTPVP